MEPEPFDLQKHCTIPPRSYQLNAFNHLCGKYENAIFLDPGMGKTKLDIDLSCYHASRNEIDLIVVIAWPNGVHHQWVDEQLPKHWWKSVPYAAWGWDGKRVPEWLMRRPDGRVHIITLNIEAARSRLMEELHKMADANGSRMKLVIDESQRIKNASSVSWKECNSLARKVRFRTILTGTPIAKNLIDEWSQFKFLNEAIIGIRYKTAFNAQFSIMGGYNNHEIVASKNIDLFNRLIAPYTFRATKDELDLPPKIYDELVFNLSNEQKRHQSDLKELFEIELRNVSSTLGENASLDSVLKVRNVGSLLVKLQQIANGFLIDNDKNVIHMKENPRLDCFTDFCEIEKSKMVVWCRFRNDIESIMHRLGEKAVVYYGASTDDEKREAKRRFINDDRVRFFVANPQSAGAGVDGLQDVCDTAVYYSQSFDSILRWQSEDRINRIGTKSSSRYFDVIGRGSIDRMIVSNHARKRAFATSALEDLESAIGELSGGNGIKELMEVVNALQV